MCSSASHSFRIRFAIVVVGPPATTAASRRDPVRLVAAVFGSLSSLGTKIHTALMDTISPVAFLTFFRPRMKYQYRDLATTGLGAKIRMRYRAGVGLVSVGKWRPMTWYS